MGIFVAERVEDTYRSVVGNLQKESMLGMSNDLDTIPISLTTPYEVMVILLLNKQPMTTKTIERQLQYSYIAKYLEQIQKEIFDVHFAEKLREITKHSEKKYHQELMSLITSYVGEYITKKEIKAGILHSIIALMSFDALQYQTQIVSILKGEPIGFRMFNPKEIPTKEKGRVRITEEKTPEEIRVKLVAELNKQFNTKIPSNSKIKSDLMYLASDKLKYIGTSSKNLRTTATSSWELDRFFYKYWLARRKEIIDEYNVEVSKYPKVIPEAQPLNTRMLPRSIPLVESPEAIASRIMVQKYSVRVLDFYLLNFTTTHESIYLSTIGLVRAWGLV